MILLFFSLQLFLGVFHSFLACNVISSSMLAWASLTNWDFGNVISYIVPFLRQGTGIHLLLSVSQSMIIRYLTEFVWKRIPPLDHDFMTFFLTINNLCFGFLLPIITCNSGTFKEVERLQGKSSYLKKKEVFNPK